MCRGVQAVLNRTPSRRPTLAASRHTPTLQDTEVLWSRPYFRPALMTSPSDTLSVVRFGFSWFLNYNLLGGLMALIYFGCLVGSTLLALAAAQRNWECVKQASLAALTVLLLPWWIFSYYVYRGGLLSTSDLTETFGDDIFGDSSLAGDRVSITKLFFTDPDEALRWVNQPETRTCSGSI